VIRPAALPILAWIALATAPADAADVFQRFLAPGVPVADGFDFPVGDADGQGSYTDPRTGRTHHGWYRATRFGDRIKLGLHPGEDWNGRGGGNTDEGQPVRSVAAGRVVEIRTGEALWGGVVVIEHLFHENHELRRVRSLYAHLGRVDVREGQDVARRQAIGTVGRDPGGLFHAHLHLELRSDCALPALYWPELERRPLAWIREHYLDPSAFISAHRTLPVPAREARLVLVDTAGYTLRTYERGVQRAEYPVSVGQAEGRKRRRGDLKTPRGMYHVTSRSRGPFDGEFGAYYGGHWIKLDYPNPFDAEWGVAEGLISERQHKQIARAWARRRLTPGSTALGGGIGVHGWIEEWPEDGPRHLSWGCIVLHNRDIGAFYEWAAEGTMVVIF